MLRMLLLASALTLACPAEAEPIRDATRQALPELMAFYRDLHAHPELSLEEIQTAAKLAKAAREPGFDVTEKVGGTGIVAILQNGPGPVVLIRADMDALPVTEQTGLAFASTKAGVMHACGHDTHMASWIGTLRNLAAMRDRWRGTLVMIAQPAEERGLGARMMLDDGLFTRFPKPDYALAFHNSDTLPAGQIGIAPGYALAGVDAVKILVKGVGGHAGFPHTTRDPVVLAARIVLALQILVSREVDPRQPAVITVGAINGGTKGNIIGDEVELLLSIRSFAREVRKQLLEGIARVARGEAIAAGMPEALYPVVTVSGEFVPSTFNTPPLSGRLKQLFTARFGEDRVHETPPAMAGEDFGRFHLADPTVESTIFTVGGMHPAAVEGSGASRTTLHSPFWAPDAEVVIGTATEAMTAAALDLLGD